MVKNNCSWDTQDPVTTPYCKAVRDCKQLERKLNLADRTYSLPPITVVTKVGKISQFKVVKYVKGQQRLQQQPPSPPQMEFNYSVVRAEPEVVVVDLE